jgi:hypothetical protein
LFITGSIFPGHNEEIILLRPDPCRIENKKDFYVRKTRISKRFRKAVYVLGTSTAAVLFGYLMFRLTKNDDKRITNDIIKNTGQSDHDLNRNGGFNYSDSLALHRAYKKELYNESIWDLCKYKLRAGVTDWVYYAPLTLLGTVLFGASSNLYYLLKDKCLQLWNGYDEEFFIKARINLALILRQFNSVLDVPEMLIDVDEVQHDYLVLLDMMENLFAMLEEKIEREFDLGNLNEHMYKAFIGNKDLLLRVFTKFIESLESFLNKSNDAILPSFKKLDKKIIRSLELYDSVFFAV